MAEDVAAPLFEGPPPVGGDGPFAIAGVRDALGAGGAASDRVWLGDGEEGEDPVDEERGLSASGSYRQAVWLRCRSAHVVLAVVAIVAASMAVLAELGIGLGDSEVVGPGAGGAAEDLGQKSLFPIDDLGIDLGQETTTTRTRTSSTRTTTSTSQARVVVTTKRTTTITTTTTTETTEQAVFQNVRTETREPIYGLAVSPARRGSAGKTRHMTGSQCLFLEESPAPEDFPELCSVSWEKYLEDASVKQACSLVGDWKELSTGGTSYSGGCHIDPETKRMKCSHESACSGGHKKTAKVTTITRSVHYVCGPTCQGALRADCCATCRSYERKPSDLEVDAVVCHGCSDKEVSEALRESDCVLVEGSFQCQTKGRCASGTQESSCDVTDYACDVVPCSSCGSDEMKAQCCSMCLEHMCDEHSDKRMVCEGCDALPGDGGLKMPSVNVPFR